LASTQEMQWVLRAQCHDREALEALLRCVQPALRRYLSGLVGSELDLRASPEAPPPNDVLRLLSTDIVSPASRAVLILHFQEELSLPDVAAILEIPLGTAKSRLAYGLRLIRNHLLASGASHD
jgi:DNA-directed RNA polymerase specialized sigma24 family protein